MSPAEWGMLHPSCFSAPTRGCTTSTKVSNETVLRLRGQNGTYEYMRNEKRHAVIKFDKLILFVNKGLMCNCSVALYYNIITSHSVSLEVLPRRGMFIGYSHMCVSVLWRGSTVT
jgi:hypothetical protein